MPPGPAKMEPTIEQLKAGSTARPLYKLQNVEVAALPGPLRGNPRFEKIVASLAPKDAASPSK